MDKNKNMRLAGGSAIQLEEDLGQKVEFHSLSLKTGFAGRIKEHDVFYVIRFMPDGLGLTSTYEDDFFAKIKEHGFVLCRQEIDWIGKEVVHYLLMEFRSDVK